MNIDHTVEALRKNGYLVSVFPTAAEADRYLNGQIDGKTVGIGGSMTIEEMGSFDTLSAHNRVFWHWHRADGVTPEDARKHAADAQVYLTSVNAISENGELVNIDGTGNRLASTLYGHEKVYFVTSTDKIAGDLHQAIDRARNVAAPPNAKRLNCKTPCAIKGDRCYDCKSPDRICNAMVIHFKKMGAVIWKLS
jgi:hypothetical protein